MPLWLLSIFDRWLGAGLLYVLGAPLRLVSRFLPGSHEVRPRHVFLKMKGGGSLIIAMPALLGLRRKYPDAEFILVCTQDAKAYAELTGVFDRYAVIDDSSFIALLLSGLKSLKTSFRAAWCIDLEPNSLLAAVFTMMSCAQRRIGLVKAGQQARHSAYTDALPFDPATSIYARYDQIAALFGAAPVPVSECSAVARALLPPPVLNKNEKLTIGLAAFASDLCRERMMPADVWAVLLKRVYEGQDIEFRIFGSARNHEAARELLSTLQVAMPQAHFMNLCGLYPLAQTAALISLCDEVWAVDSGLLHTTRLLGVPVHSFWGPTVPDSYLRPVPGLREHIHYHRFACSPCVQLGVKPPCAGHNLCMISMADNNPDRNPSWT